MVSVLLQRQVSACGVGASTDICLADSLAFMKHQKENPLIETELTSLSCYGYGYQTYGETEMTNKNTTLCRHFISDVIYFSFSSQTVPGRMGTGILELFVNIPNLSSVTGVLSGA